MYTPVFSIIIPVYNAEKYLRDCLNSILNQTFDDFEVILINDGSQDSSAMICESYSRQDSRVRTITISNNGVSHARNVGLAEAKGRYITFIDSDDWIEPDTLRAYFQAFSEDDSIDAVKSGYFHEVHGSGCEVISSGRDHIFSDQSDLFKCLEETRYYSFVWNLCIKRAKIGEIRFNEDINWLEDHIFSYECYFNCRKVKVLSRAFYHYIIRGAASTSLSHIRNPWVIAKSMDLEYKWKSRLNNSKYPDVDAMISNNYKHNVHRLVDVLYTAGFNSSQRREFRRLPLKTSDLKYREERIFYNRYIPFPVSDMLIRLLYYIHKR